MAQRRWEKTLQVPEGRAYGDSADKITVAVGGAESFGGAAAVVGVREVTVPPGGRLTQEEFEGGASNELRTVMEVMEVGGDNMDKGETAESEVDQVDVKAEVGVLGGALGTGSHRNPESGCGARRHNPQ